MNTTPAPTKPPAGPRTRWLIGLTGRRLVVTLLAAALSTLAISPIFEIPVVELFGRVTLVAPLCSC